MVATATPFTALDAEWAVVCAGRAAQASLRSWAEQCPPLADVADLEALRALLHGGRDYAVADEVLGFLLRQAAVSGGGDQFACRVLLQLLVPGLGKLARTLLWLPGDHAERQCAVLSTATELIRSCTWWPRRRRHVAKNLLLDTHMMLRRAHLRPALGEVAIGLSAPADTEFRSSWTLDEKVPDLWDTEAGDARLEWLHLLAWAQRTEVLTATELRIIVELDLQLLGAAHVGAWLHASEGAVRRRRNRALVRLRCAIADAGCGAGLAQEPLAA